MNIPERATAQEAEAAMIAQSGVLTDEHSEPGYFEKPVENECEVLIQFDGIALAAGNGEGWKKLREIERLLRELGIGFDTGAGCGARDWEWDWSLSGPVKVIFKRMTKDSEKDRYRCAVERLERAA